MVRSSLNQIHSYSIWHPLKHSFGADCITLVERLRDFDPNHKEAITFFLSQTRDCVYQSSCNVRPFNVEAMLQLCYWDHTTYLSDKCNSAEQVRFCLGPRNRDQLLIITRGDLYIHDAANDLEKRVTDVDLQTVWNGISNKVPMGSCTDFTLNPTVAASFTTVLFYGCTVVIVVDGKGVIIGHFAQETGDPNNPTAMCASMTDSTVVNTQIIPKLVNAELMSDADENTQAYIITPASTTSVGYQLISSNLQSHGVETANIHRVYYPAGNAFQSFDGPVGKAVVTWVPNAGGGATLDVYIQDNSPIFEQAYDSNGNPVGTPACAVNSKHKRQGVCALPGAAASVGGVSASSTATATTSTTTAATTPAPTCYQQNEDPDQGIQQQGCICNQGTVTKTLPLFATGVDYSSSCAYPALTASTIAITANFGPAVTNSMICSVCSPISNNGATCTSLSNCLPQTPTATIQIGSSPVPVGTLTSDALSSAISSAISSLCPPVTQTTTSTTCDETSKVTIPNIAYIDAGSLVTDGELLVQIDSSGYNDTSLLAPLAGMAALSISSSATGGNCYEAEYTTEELKAKRWYSSALDAGLGWMPFYKRDHPYPVQEKIELCNSGHFASPQIYSQWYVTPICPLESMHYSLRGLDL